MRVSVIMPCHNAGPWIHQALQSAAQQTYRPHEIIVINDRSTDDSVEKIQTSGVDVQLLHTQHGNAAAARNDGLDIATGDWIAFLDADDYWYPDHLQQAAELLAGSGDVAYMSLFKRSYSDGTVLDYGNPWPIKKPATGLTHGRFLDCWRAALRFYMSTMLARRDRINAVGRFDVSQLRRHDIELWLRLIHGQTWTFNPVPTGCQRHDNPNSVSRTSWPNSAYYMLRGVTMRMEDYTGTAMQQIASHAARQAVSVAILSGTKDDRDRVWDMAWPHLTASQRAVFRMAALCPRLYRQAHHFRAALAHRGRGSEGNPASATR